MSDWLHNLPIVWMTLLVFGLTALVIAAIYVLVTVLSVGERARSFRAVSPGMLPPLGILVRAFHCVHCGAGLESQRSGSLGRRSRV